MSRWICWLLVLAGATVLEGPTAFGQGSARPIRALLVAGGCCHDYAHQKDLLTRGISQRADVKWTIAYDPDTSTGHKNPVYEIPGWSNEFDVVVHDECTSAVTDMAFIENILRPHKEGLPGVVLHCGMHSYRTEGWNKNVATPWMQFTGLISTGHGPQKPIAITFVDQDHPITKGMSDWTTVNEELYNNIAGRIEPTAHALASGKQVYTATPKKGAKEDAKAQAKEVTAEAVVAWTNIYNGKTKVFSTTLGHNNATVEDPRYRDLVARGLLWSVGKLDPEHLKPAE